MMRTYLLRRASSSFPFTNLPADVQLLILGNVDLHTLQSTTRAIPSARELYLEYPSSILQAVTATMGPQIRNLLLTTHSLVSTIKAVDVYPQPDLDDMEKYLAENLDTEAPMKVDLLDYDALGVLHALCEIDKEVSDYVKDFAYDIYENACRCDNPGAIPPPLSLSPTEEYRMTRAFYRLKLFGVLFYNYPDRFHVSMESFQAVFFARLSAFEIDEVVTAYQFALRERRYFKSPCVHIGCSYPRLKLPTNNDPFNCQTCRGLYTMHVSKNVLEARPWGRRNVQPFWWTVSEHFAGPEDWAHPDMCKPYPIKNWHDTPDSNEPSAGWSLWREYYERSGSSVSRQLYVNVFRVLGYCFWDSTRLEGWGNMFGEQWVTEETQRWHPVWCDVCQSDGWEESCPYA